MKTLLNLQDLSKEESYALFSQFSDFSIEQQSALLALLRSKKETYEEISGAIKYFKKYSTFREHNTQVIDIVGTGGDGANTFNISTAASIIVASFGVSVSKHGGKSATSKAGSKDVIEALGIKIPQNASESLQLLNHYHYENLFAPLFNNE